MENYYRKSLMFRKSLAGIVWYFSDFDILSKIFELSWKICVKLRVTKSFYKMLRKMHNLKESGCRSLHMIYNLWKVSISFLQTYLGDKLGPNARFILAIQ